MQMVLEMNTSGGGVRDEVIGWTCNDSSLVIPDKHIGYTPGPKFNYMYSTVLHALHDNWKILGPPKKLEDDTFEWWLVRDADKKIVRRPL
jgi:hypothetical protein